MGRDRKILHCALQQSTQKVAHLGLAVPKKKKKKSFGRVIFLFNSLKALHAARNKFYDKLRSFMREKWKLEQNK